MIDRFSGEYHWLSNFHPCEVVYKGVIYPSIENAYQAAKIEMAQCRPNELHWLASCPPGRAKKLGSNVKPDGWQSYKLVVMKDLLDPKFSKPDFAQLLLETGDQQIVEGNRWGDTFWGVCNGKGSNHLGGMIQEIRGNLKRRYAKIESIRVVATGTHKELRMELSDGGNLAVQVHEHTNELDSASDALRQLAYTLDRYSGRRGQQ